MYSEVERTREKRRVHTYCMMVQINIVKINS